MFTQKQSAFHTNIRELLALKFGLEHLASHHRNIHVIAHMDNSTAVCYLNRMGGTHSDILNSLAQEIWEWALLRNIYLSAVFIAGKDNVEADYLSRIPQDRMGWMLNPRIFFKVSQKFYHPDVDLFANRINRQVQCFVASNPDPLALAMDAFSLSWKSLRAYAFPPFIMIPKVLRKVLQDNARLILITPNWPTQGWWPQVLSMVVKSPILLHPGEELLTLPHAGIKHPLRTSLSLVAWVVSGDATETMEFLRDLPASYLPPGGKEQINSMSQHGQNGLAGVQRGKLIRFQHL